LDNLEDRDKLLETYNLPELNHEEMNVETENLNRTVISEKIELVIVNLPTNKSPGPDGFTNEFYETLKK